MSLAFLATLLAITFTNASVIPAGFPQEPVDARSVIAANTNNVFQTETMSHSLPQDQHACLWQEQERRHDNF
jgi:hypothetical protein